MTHIRRLFVERKPGQRQEAESLLAELRDNLGVRRLTGVRVLQRYDVEGVPDEHWPDAVRTVFSDPAVEDVSGDPPAAGPHDHTVAVEYLPGQFDQRADSAAQCVQIVAGHRPLVAAARVHILSGGLTEDDLAKIRRFLINPVDSREAAHDIPETLERTAPEPAPVRRIDGFTTMDDAALDTLRGELGLAMGHADLVFCRDHFRDTERRDPSLTEIKVLDTYWSDHCRHTTFLAELESVEFADSPLTAPARAAWDSYLAARGEVFAERAGGRPRCLMDIALMGMRLLRARGQLDDLDASEEINAASIRVEAEIDGRREPWLVMFKNETHNHPTEIEPFGGAATCLGGCIRDPLSGRSYVYQAMRVTGSGDPRQPLSETLPGKLPQRVITRGAAHGYSSYGNQIGVATGLVSEVYDPGYVAKRMEIGAVVGAAPAANVRRERPVPGDVILLVGGRTGRDGIGGATGSSKEHTSSALENSAEVQKGDPPTERKLQRLFRDPSVSRLIKRCNDFGAGGVSVAIGELAPSLRVDLDAVPLKYDGLDGTEIALSESQERMAVVLDPADAEAFRAAAGRENLEAAAVAEVTATGRLEMIWRGDSIVSISREFLDSNGVRQTTRARVAAPAGPDFPALVGGAAAASLEDAWTAVLGDLNVCSQRGLAECFDSSIGAGSVLSPFGGRHRVTPADAMAATLPVDEGTTPAATLMAWGFHPAIGRWSPFHGAVYAVLEATAAIVAAGGRADRVRLTLQEYFEKLRDDPRRWGKPLAALLGAFHAQTALGIPAIGGKDSMSGSFEDLDVPPTLVAFALAPVDARNVLSPEFKEPGRPVYLLEVPVGPDHLPDLATARERYAALAAAVECGAVAAAQSIRAGGLGAALAKMAFGNGIGFRFAAGHSAEDRAALFGPRYGSLVLEARDPAALERAGTVAIGETLAEPVIASGTDSISLDTLRAAWEAPLESVFPTRVPAPGGCPPEQFFAPKNTCRAAAKVAKPRVFIPVFPGTNTEYDTASAFARAGAAPVTRVFRNLTDDAVEESLAAFADEVARAQILMLPGGFSAGDEPTGSGKFIAAVLRNPRVRDEVHRLLRERDGLILGICNGFQALVKTGLLPHGEIRPPDPADPTLTYNLIGRHVSCYARTRVVSKRSPWLNRCELGEIHMIPISHGEGRFTAPPETLDALRENVQIATQYVDPNGHPAHRLPDNPNGSLLAIEGITSRCGRVFGKMGHSERTGPYVAKNIPGNKDQPLFRAGVEYFG